MRVAIKFCRYPKSESDDNKKNDPFFLAGENESRHVLKARREPSTCEEVVLARERRPIHHHPANYDEH